MLEALEKELYIDPNTRDRKKILEVFELAKATQLPVVLDRKVIGILDLFAFLKDEHKKTHIIELMETDIIVAGENRNVFTFKNSTQEILPFCDEEGNFLGFVNKLFQKCYLPSKEYMEVIEQSMDLMMEGVPEDMEYDRIKTSFDAIFESNYDGIYVTVDKGATLSINDDCGYAKDISLKDITFTDEETNVNFETLASGTEKVRIVQNIQNRNEVSIPSSNVSEGGILRVINNLKDFEKIKNDLEETQKLADKYQNELEFLRWQQLKPEDVVTNSHEMKKLVNLAVRIAKVDSTVLIEGQSGVGKGVFCKLIHNSSERKNGPLIKIDCGSIPESLLESELFGYEQGAFTGAEKGGKIGLIEMANGGTLFLDEIGELPLNLQVKLLRVLQDKEIIRVGGKETIPVDARVVAATNRDLQEMVEEKTFRKDLYYRLNVVPIRIPPLKERREDIQPLIEKNLNRLNEKYNSRVSLDPSALKSMLDYSWPGNVRELENVVEYAVVTSNTGVIKKENLPADIRDFAGEICCSILSLENVESLKGTMEEVEKTILEEAMERSKSTEEMGKLLKLDRSTITRKLQKHGIKPRFE